MPHQDKPGVNWDEIRQRYEAGESPGAISRSGAGVSKQRIQQKVNKLGWSQDPEKRRQLDSQRQWERRLAEVPKGDDKTLAARFKNSWGKASPESKAAILEALERGASVELAAKAAGIHRDTLHQWRTEDPEFAEMCEAAAAICAVEHVGVVDHAGRVTKDWKASDRMLSRHPMTKGDWAEKPSGGGPNIQVVLNVSRGTAAASLETVDVVTIEHEQPDGFDG